MLSLSLYPFSLTIFILFYNVSHAHKYLLVDRIAMTMVNAAATLISHVTRLIVSINNENTHTRTCFYIRINSRLSGISSRTMTTRPRVKTGTFPLEYSRQLLGRPTPKLYSLVPTLYLDPTTSVFPIVSSEGYERGGEKQNTFSSFPLRSENRAEPRCEGSSVL